MTLQSPPKIVGRLAPSPTGAQHIGNARTYLIAWLSIRQKQGRMLLRMEDIDSPRIKPYAAQQALEDLRWLELTWDEGPDLGGPHAPYVQTQRKALYDDLLQQLQVNEQVYPCTCTRSDVAAAASAPHLGQEGPRYPGTCSYRCANDAQQLMLQCVPFSWRFRTNPSQPADQFLDGIAGLQTCNLHAELGDFVVYKSDGTPAYQLAVVADDHVMGVTEVVRGSDLLPSTFRQRAIYQFFGWQPPQFIHAPLVIGADGRRLAKRHGDTRISLLRESNIPPERLLGWLAHSCGWLPHPTEISASELLPLFHLESIKKDPQVFTPADLDWLLTGSV